MPEEEHMTEKVFMERTEEDEGNTKFHFMFSGYKWALSMISGPEEKVLLDCACGRGYGSHYLAGFAKKVTGVDVSAEAIDYCKRTYKRPNLDYFCADASRLPFPDEAFDAVISQDTIEHVRDDAAFLSELRRVLRPGGSAFIFTPHSAVHNEKPENPFHLREYSRGSLNELLKAYFTDVRYFGKRLSPQLAALEATLSKVRGRDQLNLRRFVPRRLRHFIGDIIARISGKKPISSITEDDVDFVEDPDESLTLIAVCRKAPERSR